MNVPKPFVRIIYLLMRAYWWIFRPVRYGVRVMIIKNNQIALVKPKYKKKLNFPGGGVKRGEDLEIAARREVMEEMNIKMKSLKKIGSYINLTEKKHDHIILFFCGDFIENQGNVSWEIESKGFYPLNNLPKDTGIGVRKRIKEFRNDNLGKTNHW